MLVLGDLLSETDEHFTVTLRGPSNATLADATATGTIRDDDDRATPGNTFRDCAVCPQMVTVPAGSYLMGSPAAEAGRHADEEQPTVTIADRLAVGAYEVTFAEWEYAARAGTTTPFHTGAMIATDQANYDGLSTPYGAGVRGTYRARTTEVGSFVPNAFGLHDVHGNAAELVQDCYEDTPGATCSGRVVRGGSWASGPERLRSAYRGWCAPTLRNHLNGFRVARSAP